MTATAQQQLEDALQRERRRGWSNAAHLHEIEQLRTVVLAQQQREHRTRETLEKMKDKP